MPEVSIALSANAGVSIGIGGRKIWVDALYTDKGDTFSPLRPELCQRLMATEAFTAPDYILYTHCHGDHYSRELTCMAMKKWPGARVFLPEQELEGQILVSGREFRHEIGDLSLRFLKLPHEGAQYADVKHYGLLIGTPGCNILLPGDCQVAASALAQAIGDTKIDVAVLDFPWITLHRGRDFVKEYIRPDHVIAYHLPFAEDDVNGYRLSAGKAADALKKELDVRLLWDPLQEEVINI